MAQAQYVSLQNLTLYDQKIKAKMATDDAATLASAKTYADGKDAAIAEAKKAGDDAAVAAKAADDKAVAAQGDVDALEAYVGTFTASQGVDTVVKYVDAKTANIASSDTVTALTTRVTQAEADIDAIEADYLKAADKTALEGQIATEKSRAEGIEAGLRTDVNAVMADYLKAADKTELQGNIDTVSGTLADVKEDVDAFFKDADMTASAKDTLKELQEYIASDESGAAAMAASIQQNTNDIAALDGRMDTAEGKITTVEGAVATLNGADTEVGSVAKAVADGVTEAKNYADGLNTAMDSRMTVVETKADTNETAIGVLNGADTVEGSVAKALKDAKAYTDTKDAAMDGKKADKATTLAGYGIADAYTKTETDNAISNAMAQITPIDDSAINNLFA